MRYKVFISAIAFFLLSTASHSLTIDSEIIKEIDECLSRGSATTICEYPKDWRESNEPLHIARNITWDTPATLQLVSKEDIIFEKDAFIKSEGAGSLLLKAGMENQRSRDSGIGQGKVVFKGETPQVIFKESGRIKVYYNPELNPSDVEYSHKYHNPIDHEKHIAVSRPENLESYMLVNDVYDLQDIVMSLSKNYALSQDIDASVTKTWGIEGFKPLKDASKGKYGQPFSGTFDGSGYTISNLYINRPDEDKVGLFGMTGGFDTKPSQIKNLTLHNFRITGDHYVGSLIGFAVKTNLQYITVSSPHVKGNAVVGGFVGTSHKMEANKILLHNLDASQINASEYKGLICGTTTDSNYFLIPSESLPQNIYGGDVSAISALGTFDTISSISICIKNKHE